MRKSDIKHNHHHVWADYLKNWSENGRDVWCSTSNKNVHCTSVVGIFRTYDFYKVQPLNEQDISFIKHVIGQCSDEKIRQHYEKFLHDCVLIQILHERYSNNLICDDEYEHLYEKYTHNLLEDTHGAIERKSKQILIELKNDDISSFSDTKKRVALMYFLGHQLTRTKSLKNKIEQSDLFLSNIKNNWWILSYIMGSNVGTSLIHNYNNATEVLLVNDSSTPFITGDQPVINIHPSVNRDGFEPPQYLDLYFPVSPTRAILISESQSFKSGIASIDDSFAQELNQRIAEQSNVEIVGCSKQIVKDSLKFIGHKTKQANGFFNKKNSS